MGKIKYINEADKNGHEPYQVEIHVRGGVMSVCNHGKDIHNLIHNAIKEFRFEKITMEEIIEVRVFDATYGIYPKWRRCLLGVWVNPKFRLI